jgi:hypothetical protein
MSISVFILYIASLFFLISLAKLYWSWKRSVSGIALGAATMLVTILMITQLLVKVDIVQFVIELVSGHDIKDSLEKSKPTTLVLIINLIVVLISAVGVFMLGYFGIRNYKGPVKSSEWDAKNGENRAFGSYLRRLIIADIKYLTKPNSIIYREGRDPYKILPISEPKPWREIALDLLKASNRDVSSKAVKWSDSDKCYILEKNDLIRKTTKIVYFFPLHGNSLTDAILASINKIEDHFSDDSEIILCFEEFTSEKVNQTTKKGRDYFVTDKIRLIEKSTDLTSYAKSILERYQKDVVLRYLEIESDKGSTWKELTLEETYSNLRVSPYKPSNDSKGESIDIQDLISRWLENKASPQLSILGQFGQGKSTAMLHLAADWARGYLKPKSNEFDRGSRSRVPLLIELRGRSPKDQSTSIGILGEWGHQYGLSGEQLYNLVNSKMAILIFEGFDEVKNAGRKLDRYEHFNALWKFAFEGSKIIFTGRPNFFLDDEERVQFLNSHSDVLSNGSSISSAYSIEFLNINDIENMLRSVSGDLREDVVSHSTKDSLLMDIAKRPSMLPVVVSQWDKIKLAQDRGEKITSSQIVKSYIEATYKRKDEEIINRGKYQLLPWEIRHFITQAVCLDMISNNEKNTTTADKISNVIRRIEPYFNSVFMNDESPAHLVEAVTQLNYIKNSGDKLYRDYISEISSDVRSNGLLASDPATGSRSLYFPHKQFYEYILGETYASIFKAPKSQASLALIKHQGRGYVNFLKASSREPMIVQYFSGIFTSEYICKLTPGLDDKNYVRLFKPIYIVINKLYQQCFGEFAGLAEYLEADGRERFEISWISIFKNIAPVFKKPRVLIASLGLFVCIPFIFMFKIAGASVQESANVKYALMKYRCQTHDIELVFKNKGYRRYLAAIFNLGYQAGKMR